MSLTNEEAQLQLIKRTIEQTSMIDSKRIEALRAAIADGSYSIDANELAQKIIDFEIQLL